jgi:hypothetical protein
MEKVGWHEKIKRQLEVVQRWRQSGQSMAAWGAAHGVDAKLLMGWISYEKRWLQRLAADHLQLHESRSVDRVATNAAIKVPAPAKPKGFVAARSSDVQALRSAASSAVASTASDCAWSPVHPNPTSVRIECAVAGIKAGLVLHWPMAQTQELAAWLKSMAAASDASLSGTSISGSKSS